MSIFSNGIELTDAELAALPIDHMAVWLDMWQEARDQDSYALRQAEEGYEPVICREPLGCRDHDYCHCTHEYQCTQLA